ncbi:hypothetical protein P43SY_008375 [Pythium insidiosum]|uniref:Uncharacterized protein n=1 Tax=Pythium insidiosum TaxID=114742 RepID=A0AAD5LPR5_PYTIN|nr:hypothetical protein P43SY_008373 [Pythium insidiosum]KAJ0406124.1 hypothetical protein P43SY_008375 [Pythium insidiosum]
MKVNHVVNPTRAVSTYKVRDHVAASPKSLLRAVRPSFPFPDGFYKEADRELISGSHRVLMWTSSVVYAAALAVFVVLVAVGLLDKKEVKLTQILASPMTDANTVCVNLGTFTGGAPSYQVDSTAALKALSEPRQQPVNCKTASEMHLPADATIKPWMTLELNFVKAYFTSFQDCREKLPGVVEKITTAVSFRNDAFSVYPQWEPYTSQDGSGGSLGSFELSVKGRGSFEVAPDCTEKNAGRSSTCVYPAGASVSRWFDLRDGSNQPITSCLVDGSNLSPPTTVIGQVLPDSAIDLFHKHSMPRLMQNAFRDHYDTMCEPFNSTGPFQCTTTLFVDADPLGVIGSSFANAQAFMTAAVMLAAFVIKRCCRDDHHQQQQQPQPQEVTPPKPLSDHEGAQSNEATSPPAVGDDQSALPSKPTP